MYSEQVLRPKTVKLLKQIMLPWIDEGVIASLEAKNIISNLNYLIKHNEIIPSIVPKLLTQQETADMLNIGLSNFKYLEKNGEFPFKRKTIGGSVRYSNISVIEYLMAADDDTEDQPEDQEPECK